MKLVPRLVLAGAVALSFAVVAPASANDCSNPKQPCGGCSLNPEATSVFDLVRCYPV